MTQADDTRSMIVAIAKMAERAVNRGSNAVLETENGISAMALAVAALTNARTQALQEVSDLHERAIIGLYELEQESGNQFVMNAVSEMRTAITNLTDYANHLTVAIDTLESMARLTQFWKEHELMDSGEHLRESLSNLAEYNSQL